MDEHEDSNVQHQNTVLDFSERYTAVRERKNNEIPELAKSANRIAKKQLHTHLQKMFDNVDDSLFEYADRAENNKQQTLYFDAMREIRVAKNAVEKAFALNCEKLFTEILHGGNLKDYDSELPASGTSFATLSLVEEDDLEESLAVSNMVTKAHNLYREELLAIAHRFDDIIDNHTMTADNNPVSPDLICKAFAMASERFSENLEIKLIVYKLFDKFVISQLEQMYKEINAMFVAAGVLPTIRLKAPVKSESTPVRPAYIEEELLPELQAEQIGKNPLTAPLPSVAVPGEVVNAGGALFESLQQLLSLQRLGGAAAQASPDAASAPVTNTLEGTGYANTAAPDVNTTPAATGFYVASDIVSGLSHMQASTGEAVHRNSDTPSGQTIKTTLLKTMGVQQSHDMPKDLERTESDVIDIVSMMFDFILDDHTLSDAIRALIARLQIPIIKLAILDKTFFNKKAHPARLLLNELAYAGSVLDDEADSHDSSLYQEVGAVVDRVVTEFDTDISLFDELLQAFRAFVETELEANKLAGEMLEVTKQTVSDKIETCIRQYKIPACIHDFLVEKWKEVLTEIGLRDHCDGPAWQAALEVADDLVWSVQPKLQVGERHELVRIIPGILNGLQDGLMLIGTPQEEINAYLQQLEELHLASLKGVRENVALDYAPASALTNSGTQADSKQSETQYYSGDEADLGYIKLTPELVNNQIFAFVRDMEIGTWVEFYNQDTIKRGKLSWKCDFTGDYTFVDRRYRVVADIAVSDLVKRLESGKAAIVEDVPLLDKAIDAVVNTMKRCVEAPQQLLPVN